MRPTKRAIFSLLCFSSTSLPPISANDADGDYLRHPKENYMIFCQGCHAAKGQGLTDQVPAFKGQVSKFLSIEGGREYLIQVPGVSKSAMSSEALADLMNWIVQEFDPNHIPDNFAPFSTAEIETLRQVSLTKATEVRRTILNKE